MYNTVQYIRYNSEEYRINTVKYSSLKSSVPYLSVAEDLLHCEQADNYEHEHCKDM